MQLFDNENSDKQLFTTETHPDVKATEVHFVNNLSTFPLTTGLNYNAQNLIHLTLIYWDLILILNSCVAEFKNKAMYSNYEKLIEVLEVLVENGHLVGINNLINDSVENAQQIIEATLRIAVTNRQAEITQILLTLHKSQISDEAIQENLSLANNTSTQDIYKLLENIAHERDLMGDTPGCWYTGSNLA